MAALAALGAGTWLAPGRFNKPIPGGILGASSLKGHKLRSGGFPEPMRTIQKDVVIVGGGIAGLATGYRLEKAGLRNFALLELENEAGGNASSGKNAVSAYPWGAHYVPLVTEEATAVKQLFEELGIIVGHDAKGLPIYNEYYVGADPHERLYMYGRWQEGLVPAIGITPEEEAQYKRFFAMMAGFKKLKGIDGKRAFAIPVDKSSQDPQWLALDELTMEEWLNKERFSSPRLRWYVNYCCRDDFGATFHDTSAWAGIHYFASRSGQAANTDAQNVVTWPEGNGWLAHKLAEPIAERIVPNALVFKITDRDGEVAIDYWDSANDRTVRIQAKAVVVATPRFVASRLLDSDRLSLSAEAFSYSPWAVANITLGKMPSGKGAPLSWDNVVYNSALLGYVVATHQVPQMKPVNTVITYYWPLSHLAPAEARQEALKRPYQDWQQIVLKELLSVHPELEGNIERLDLWIWGHAMVRPTKGFIWGAARREALKQHPPVFFAHSDMSGISIFEEAYTHGVAAAEGVLAFMNHGRQASS
jgi:protoporphyrinogen oxidase